MSYRISLKATALLNSNNENATNSPDILDTLVKIAKLPIDDNDNNDTIHDDSNGSSNDNINDDRNDDINEIKRKQTSLFSIVQSIQQQQSPNDDQCKGTCSTILLPLSAITMAKQIVVAFQQMTMTSSNSSSTTSMSLLSELESNLKENNSLQLHFTTHKSNNNDNDDSNSQYKKRIEQLRLNIEERNYTKLTSNINSLSTSLDDANVSSMLYASSVGLNMIVAPISIGVLMYFFAGKLFLWLFGNDSIDDSNHSLLYNKNEKLNIHGVIVGVISGVIMLFIEMILFVIRNHEMDTHLSNKKKKRKKNPFGYDKKTAERTFNG